MKKRFSVSQCSVESRAVKRRLGGWCEMAASMGGSQLKHRVLQECSVGREPPFREDVSAEAEESPLLEGVTRKQLVETVTD
jgi:hypothetical protein